MTTTKSFSDAGGMGKLYITALRRLLSFSIISFIAMFIAMPLPYFVAQQGHDHILTAFANDPLLSERIRAYYQGLFQNGIFFSVAQPGCIAFVLAALAFTGTLAASRYLHSKKMTDLYHSLPVRREKLMLSNMLACLTAVLGPYIILYAVTACGQIIAYGKYGWLGTWYFQFAAMDILTTMIFVAVACALVTFVSVNVGATLDALSISAALGFMPSAVYLICGLVWQTFTYGAEFTADLALLLSPYLFFFQRYLYVNESVTPLMYDYGSVALLFGVWLVLGALLTAGALFCYRRRKSELAEQTQPRGVFQLIVKCFAVLCGSTLFLAFFSERQMPVQLIAMMGGALSFGVIAELILSRGLHYLRKNLVWLAVAGAFCCVMLTLVQYDTFGYTARVPVADQVEAVRISYRGRFENDVTREYAMRQFAYYTTYSGSGFVSNSYSTTHGESAWLESPESIALVTESHSMMVADYPNQRLRRGWNSADYPGSSVRIDYKLKNGGTMSRSFYPINKEAFLNLTGLDANADFIAANHPVFYMDEYPTATQSELITRVGISDILNQNERPLELSQQNLELLIDALQKDIAGESLEEILRPTQPAIGYLKLYYNFPQQEGESYDFEIQPYASYTQDYPLMYGAKFEYRFMSSILITGQYHNTISLLREWGEYGSLSIDPEKVTGLYLYDNSDEMSYNGYRVRYSDSAYAPDWKYVTENNQYAAYLESPDARTVSEVLERGRNRILFDDQAIRDMLVVAYELEDGLYGAQYIKISDLPPELYEKAAAILARREQQSDVRISMLADPGSGAIIGSSDSATVTIVQ